MPSVGVFGAAGVPAAPVFAAPAGAPRLPARGNIVIRNAYVMTMEPGTPDIKDGDVHVKDGVIVAVGQKLNTPGATTINGAGMIVLPGLVETHWHMWNTLLRSMSGEKPEFGYFRTTAALGQKPPSDLPAIETREQLRSILRSHPPQVSTVLRLDIRESRLLLDHRGHPVEAVHKLAVDWVLDPKCAVLIEGSNAISRRNKLRASLVRCGTHEVEDRLLRGPAIPRRQRAAGRCGLCLRGSSKERSCGFSFFRS